MSERDNNGSDIGGTQVGIVSLLGMVIAFVGILYLAYLTS